MELGSYCDFLQRLMRVNVLVGEKGLAEYCAGARFHPAQDHFFPDVMHSVLSSVGECEIASMTDIFQMRLVFTRIGGESVLAGPFCGEIISSSDARALLRKAGADEEKAQDLVAYRSKYPVLKARDVVRAIHIIMFLVLGVNDFPETRTIDLTAPPAVRETEGELQTYAEQVSERYAIELKMMEDIANGNAAGALLNWHSLHRRMEYLKRILGYTIDSARESAAVTRTVIRIAGMNAGIPAHILDELTAEAGKIVRKARTLDEISGTTERLIRSVCREAKRLRDGESYLCSSVRFFLRNHYAEDITVAGMAEYLDMPESRLIERFREETGETPGAFLCRVRMKKAAELLESTRWTVQHISAEVGVPDANYFIKLFKREYGMTPTAYRKSRS